MTVINGLEVTPPKVDKRTTAEALEDSMRLINRVLFELSTEHPDPDTIPLTHRRIIQAHTQSLFKSSWVSKLAGKLAGGGIDETVLAALEGKTETQARLTVIAQARAFGYTGDDYERAGRFVDDYVKKHPDVKPFVGDDVEVIDMGGE